MDLGQLRDLVNVVLKDEPNDRLLILSSDAEGNDFNKWSGDHGVVGWDTLMDEEASYELEDGETLDDAIDADDTAVKAIVLWPV